MICLKCEKKSAKFSNIDLGGDEMECGEACPNCGSRLVVCEYTYSTAKDLWKAKKEVDRLSRINDRLLKHRARFFRAAVKYKSELKAERAEVDIESIVIGVFENAVCNKFEGCDCNSFEPNNDSCPAFNKFEELIDNELSKSEKKLKKGKNTEKK